MWSYCKVSTYAGAHITVDDGDVIADTGAGRWMFNKEGSYVRDLSPTLTVIQVAKP